MPGSFASTKWIYYNLIDDNVGSPILLSYVPDIVCFADVSVYFFLVGEMEHSHLEQSYGEGILTIPF